MQSNQSDKNLPVIDRDICTACGACIAVCPDRVLKRDSEGKPVINGEHCMICSHCYAVCPVKAIAIPGLENNLRLTCMDEEEEGTGAADFSTRDLVGLMRRRRSCRAFQPGHVEQSLLGDLVKIGTTAPSGTNSQGWQFLILPERRDVMRLGAATAEFYRDLNKKAVNPLYRLAARLFAGDALGRYYQRYYQTVKAGLEQWDESGVDLLFHGAPAAILVAADETSSCPAEDALLATQNILLAAQSLGLGTCLIGFVVEALKRDRRISVMLGLGKNERVFSVIACGYPAIAFHRPAGRKPIRPKILNLSREEP